MRWWIYQALFAVVYVALLPRFLLRMCRRGGYANRFADRFGHYPREVSEKLAELRGKAVWIHAVSVGEVYVAAQMMAALREQMPDIRFVFSTTSSTGWTEASQRVTDRDVLIYCPLDFPPCVKRALDAVQPRAFILTETEIWPNLIRSCHRRGIPLFLINARVSDHSAPGYRRLRYWFGPVLRMFTRIFAQSEQDRDRLREAIFDNQIIFYGAWDGDRLVGCCSVTIGFSTFLYAPSGVFEDFYIRPEYRHQGIARELVRFARRDSGVCSLTVGGADCDVPMYQSLGFSVPLGNLLAFDA